MNATIPAPATIGGVLSELLGRHADARETRPEPIPHEGAVAVYMDTSGVIRAVAVCDLRFAANAGAAGRLLSRSAAWRCEASGMLTPTIRAQFTQFAGALHRLFEQPQGEQLHLDRIHFLPSSLPDPVQSNLRGSHGRVDVDVDIEGYGHGTLTLVRS